MMSNNKILTVSYGTFSCTLEGFDDSFDTMKAIAEYFRDLASDDRYFGAEPPQPDAEMLARIAEREIARRVEAHVSETGVHLRAGQTALPPAAPGSGKSDSPDPEIGARNEANAETTETARETDPCDALHAKPDEAPDSPAASTSNQPAWSTTAGLGEATIGYTAFTAPGALSAAAAEPDTPPGAHSQSAVKSPSDLQAEPAGPTVPDDDAASFFAQRVDDDDLIPVAEDVPPSEARPSPNSITFKLQRIRAVVSTAPQAAAAYSEDEHSEALPGTLGRQPDVTLEEAFSREMAGDAPEPTSVELEASRIDEPEASVVTEDDFAEDVSRHEGDDAGETEPKQGRANENAELAATLARFAEAFDADVEAGYSTEAKTDASGIGEAAAAEGTLEIPAPTDDTSPADPSVPAHDSEDGENRPKVRARVIKVKRSELEAALSEGMLEEAKADREWQHLEQAEDRSADGSLAPSGSDETDSEATQRTKHPSAHEGELNRLMAETDHQLDDPNASQRRAAFEQMRGAVAASRDDDGMDAQDTDEDAYRDDLAASVTPRRPVAKGGSDRSRERPAPLKLIAAQRINAPEQPKEPVRPRRVAAAAPNSDEDKVIFADYADARGAHDLPDLLEAAAAYVSFVAGHEQFSFPQLMTMVSQLDPEGFTREDGLRHFGQLLRSGKIEKIKGGRFAASDDIGFRPDGNRAAG
jgi:hypothetical protein